MTNFCNDPKQVTEAFEKGLITEQDYNAFMGAQAYKSELRKSLDTEIISKAAYSQETAKVDGVHFERDFGASVFRFKLGGAFQPLDLVGLRKSKDKELLLKARENRPLQSSSIPKFKSNHVAKLVQQAEDLKKWCTDFSKKHGFKK